MLNGVGGAFNSYDRLITERYGEFCWVSDSKRVELLGNLCRGWLPTRMCGLEVAIELNVPGF